jgi:hypothetical protein
MFGELNGFKMCQITVGVRTRFQCRTCGGGRVRHARAIIVNQQELASELRSAMGLNHPSRKDTSGMQFLIVTSTCLYGELLSKPLGHAAGKLREAIERLTDE